jgi:DNA-formamidopyrimidine glycosylase
MNKLGKIKNLYNIMPEGPEVKKVTTKLDKNLKNKFLKKIVVQNGKYLKFKDQFINIANILPLKIKNVKCKGKFIYIEFYDSDIIIFNTLGMSGYWFTKKETKEQPETGYYSKKHNNIEFILDTKESIYFNDMRNFGNIIISTKNELENKLNTLGIDVLSPNNEINKFKNLLTKKSNMDKIICKLLLDQTIVAGCGNYMRAEVLYLANINPFIKIKKLSDIDIKNIYKYLKKVAYIFYNKKLGIKYGILDANDKLFDLYGNDRIFLIYDQNYGPNGEIIKTKKIDERTIHYVDK